MRRSRLILVFLALTLAFVLPTPGAAKGSSSSKTEGGDTPVNISGIIGSVSGKDGKKRGSKG